MSTHSLPLVVLLVEDNPSMRATAGNVAGHVILQVENPDRYRPHPGHAGFGIMKAEVPGDPDEGACVIECAKDERLLRLLR